MSKENIVDRAIDELNKILSPYQPFKNNVIIETIDNFSIRVKMPVDNAEAITTLKKILENHGHDKDPLETEYEYSNINEGNVTPSNNTTNSFVFQKSVKMRNAGSRDFVSKVCNTRIGRNTASIDLSGDNNENPEISQVNQTVKSVIDNDDIDLNEIDEKQRLPNYNNQSVTLTREFLPKSQVLTIMQDSKIENFPFMNQINAIKIELDKNFNKQRNCQIM